MADAGDDPPTLRVVVCDDDPIVRGVIRDLVAEAGGEVLAEADTGAEANLLVDRFRPDLVVLDMNLRRGSGREVLEHLQGRDDGPRIVVFTAYDAAAPNTGPLVDVVHKPDFEALAACLTSIPERVTERRRPTRDVARPARPGIDDPTTFYRDLGATLPGDVLVRVVLDGTDADLVVEALRRAVRAQDRVLRRSDDALLLLIAGGTEAVPALCGRLRATLPDVDARVTSVDVGEDPTGAFGRLTT